MENERGSSKGDEERSGWRCCWNDGRLLLSLWTGTKAPRPLRLIRGDFDPLILECDMMVGRAALRFDEVGGGVGVVVGAGGFGGMEEVV